MCIYMCMYIYMYLFEAELLYGQTLHSLLPSEIGVRGGVRISPMRR